MSSSSDEAPEEVTFQDAKLSTRLSEKRKRQAELEKVKLEKQKRREKDQRLKEQQQTHKRKLLSDILKDDDEEDDEEDNDEDKIVVATVPSKPPAAKKKTFAEREGYKLQVLEKPTSSKKKRLPPAGTDAVRRKETFLFRESVPRK